MRIVDRNTFLSMPSGTLYAKYEPCLFGPLEIKGASLSHDFLSQQIVGAIECSDSGEWGNLLDDAEQNGVSLPMDFKCMGRDGCFDEHQLFSVFEDVDVTALLERIKQG